MQTFSDILRQWRIAHQLTQSSLACRLGCSPATVSGYECARRKYYMPYLIRLAAYMRMPVADLLQQLLQYCPASERLLLQGELDYQRQIEQVQANRCRRRSEDQSLLLIACQKKLQQVGLQMRQLLQQCEGQLPAPYCPGVPFGGSAQEELRLCWDRCSVAQRLLHKDEDQLRWRKAATQIARKRHDQQALRWQQAFRALRQIALAA